MFVAASLAVVLTAALVIVLRTLGKGRQISRVNGFRTSPQAIELLHASVAAVPANAFDARLRIVRR